MYIKKMFGVFMPDAKANVSEVVPFLFRCEVFQTDMRNGSQI
jgi:hypothetical protein